MDWLWFAAGAAVAGVTCTAVLLLVTRRAWRNVRKLSARTKGYDHLVELGTLAGGLAHEIKNPLSTINVNLSLLAEDLARTDDEDHRRWLRRLTGVRQEADRLREILDDFLHFAGKHELDLAVTDLRRVIDELAGFFQPQAQAARVIMRTSLPAEPVLCRVDARLIKQALLNLLINAVDAMTATSAGAGGELLVKLSADRRQACIEVIDTGPGIPDNQIERIFDVYYSTKKHGTGLGLPTTRRIVHEHEGTIRAESEVGKGTRFTIALPLAPA